MQILEKIFKNNSQKIDKPKITRNDITQEIYNELENEFYQKFEFMKLYQPLNEEETWQKYIPIANIVISLITMILITKL